LLQVKDPDYKKVTDKNITSSYQSYLNNMNASDSDLTTIDSAGTDYDLITKAYKKASVVYKETQNAIYKCAVIRAKIKI
jgi:hypothetical protein